MRLTGLPRIFPGGPRPASSPGAPPAAPRPQPQPQVAAPAAAAIAVLPTPPVVELTWRQSLQQRSVRYTFLARSARVTYDGLGVQQLVPWIST